MNIPSGQFRRPLWVAATSWWLPPVSVSAPQPRRRVLPPMRPAFPTPAPTPSERHDRPQPVIPPGIQSRLPRRHGAETPAPVVDNVAAVHCVRVGDAGGQLLIAR